MNTHPSSLSSWARPTTAPTWPKRTESKCPQEESAHIHCNCLSVYHWLHLHKSIENMVSQVCPAHSQPTNSPAQHAVCCVRGAAPRDHRADEKLWLTAANQEPPKGAHCTVSQEKAQNSYTNGWFPLNKYGFPPPYLRGWQPCFHHCSISLFSLPPSFLELSTHWHLDPRV